MRLCWDGNSGLRPPENSEKTPAKVFKRSQKNSKSAIFTTEKTGSGRRKFNTNASRSGFCHDKTPNAPTNKGGDASYHRSTTQSDQIKPNEGTQLVRLFKLRSVCECTSVGGVKYQSSIIQRSITNPNQWAASLRRRAERERKLRWQKPSGGGRNHPEKTQHVGHQAARTGSAPTHTNKDSWDDVLWAQESELPGYQNKGHVWTLCLLGRMEMEVSGTLQPDIDTKPSSRSAKGPAAKSDLESAGSAGAR